MKEMDRNSAIQMLIGAVMGYIDAERRASGMDISELDIVAMDALVHLGVSPDEMRYAVETAPFLTPKPQEEVREEPEDLLKMLTIRFPPQP